MSISANTPSYFLSESRLTRIAAAQTQEEATHMSVLDSFLDWIWRGGVKRQAIEEVFNAIQSMHDTASNIPERLQKFKELRGFAHPESRHLFKINYESSGDTQSDEYSFKIGDYSIFKGEVAHSDQSGNLAIIETQDYFKVDDYLMKIQGNSDTAISLLPLNRDFSVKQGKTGDCYAISTMIGLLANGKTRQEIERMARINEETGNIDLGFMIDPELSISPSPTIRIPIKSYLENSSFLDQMRRKGYDIKFDPPRELCVELNPERLKSILGNSINAQTNALLCNIIEHIVGNFILATNFNGKIDNIIIDDDSVLISKSKTNNYTDFVDLDLSEDGLSKSPSIFSHSSKVSGRKFNYNNLIANLFGYSCTSRFSPTTEYPLEKLLTLIKRGGAAIDDPVSQKNSFCYISMDWGAPDKEGVIHGRHALIVGDVLFDKNTPSVVKGVDLINPHDSDAPFFMSLDKLKELSPVFELYRKK